MPFDSSLLHYFVRDALQNYSHNFQIVDRVNPVSVVLNTATYSVHVSYIHDSGNNRPNDDETRIQISRAQINLQAERASSGERVAFIGFSENGSYFTAWDPEHVFSLNAGTVVSLYGKASMARRAMELGGAARRFRSAAAGTTFLTIVLPATALGFYLENLANFHQLQDERELLATLGRYADAVAEAGEQGQALREMDAPPGTDQQEEERRKFTYQRTAYPRDPKFASAVLEAYGNSCCICGKQLAIVQAAHIIPHSSAAAEDTIRNGVALCIEHHRLYDDALLLLAPKGKLIVNEDRARYLVETKRANGLDSVRAAAARGYRLPDDAANHPSDEYLERGIKMRLAD